MFNIVFLSARGVQEETTFVCLLVLLAKSDVNIKHNEECFIKYQNTEK